MLRLAASKGLRLEQALPGSFSATFGGSEANVAASLTQFGTQAHYVTALPPGPLTKAFSRELRGLGARVTVCEVPDSRFGIYFVEHGSGPRAGSVIYDRSGSGVAMADFDVYPFEELFESSKALHISGITPSISRTACKTTLRVVQAAKERGLFVSCDLNYRAKLWRWDDEMRCVELAREWMPQIVQHADLLAGNENDFSDALGIFSGHASNVAGGLNVDDYEKVAKKAAQIFPNLKFVASSLRGSFSAELNYWGGMLYDAQKDRAHFAPITSGKYDPYELHITDRFGAGDSFVGGLLHALFSDNLCAPEQAIQFAVAASALKHTIHGDYNRVSCDEVIDLMNGNKAGRVQR